jgi:protein phosphatase
MAMTNGMSWWRRWLGSSASPPPVRPTLDLVVPFAALALPEQLLATGIASDVGCVRSTNEDAATILTDVASTDGRGVLAVICDGMGGHSAGEVASAIAVQTVEAAWPMLDDAAALPDAIQLANQAIVAEARQDASHRGMGTTCLLLWARGGLLHCAHVGDSRCYLLRDDRLLLMTEDHSAVMTMVRRGEISAADARHHPDKNIISRALGARREVEVSTWPQPFRARPNDRFLLCTDGLYDLVSDEVILRCLRDLLPQSACDQLVAEARARGAPDNVTVIVLSYPSEPIA